MKKLILFLPILFVGCAMFKPSEMMRKSECLDADYIDISQVLDDGLLGKICVYTNGRAYYCGDLDVFLEIKTKNKNYVDGLRAIFDKTECPIKTGTYSYTTIFGAKKTIYKIRMTEAQIPNPDFAKQQNKNKSESELSSIPPPGELPF